MPTLRREVTMTTLGIPRSLFDAAALPPSVALLRVVAVKTHDQSRIRARITLCTAVGAVVETITPAWAVPAGRCWRCPRFASSHSGVG